MDKLKMKLLVFSAFASIFLICSCKPSEKENDSKILVKVNEFTLTQNEVEKVIPKSASPSDSLLRAENYIKKWVKDILTYEVAQRNLSKDEETINRLVDEYKRSLMRHRYQEQIVQSRLSAEIKESDKEAFYHESPQRFKLDKNLIKGLFLKIPADAPGLDQVRKWYKSKDPQAIENIEKYGIQNAADYDYFYDRWIDFNEVLDKMPIRVSNQSQYLKSNQTVEISDSSYCYFLNISESLLVGNTAPYEYVEPQVQEMIINKRKVEFLKDFEEELYRDAVRKGQVEFYTNQK